MMRKIDRLRVRFKINGSDVSKALIFNHKMNIIHMYFRRYGAPIAESDFQYVVKFLKKNEHKNSRYFSFLINLFFRRQQNWRID